ncbi:hypothetical protein ACFL9T_17330 [Thermodesulfobacteriota bacterium]
MKLINEASIKKFEEALRNITEAANELRDASDWKWHNFLMEKKDELLGLLKEMEEDLLEE